MRAVRIMRLVGLGCAAAAAALFLDASAPVRADWCGIGSYGVTNCGYPTFELCRIGLNGVGNCYEQTPPAPKAGVRTRRPAR